MDYLLRDSLYTGVQYGKFDADRLIETLCLVKREDGNFDIGIEERGKHAAEGLILARYFMFTQVYFHALRRIYDIHLLQFIREMLQETIGSEIFPADIGEYLDWDDIKVLVMAINMTINRAVDKETCAECVISFHPWFKLGKRRRVP